MPVLTVRMPPELYAAFHELAHHQRQSMNALAVSLFTQAIETNPAANSILVALASDIRSDRLQLRIDHADSASTQCSRHE